MKPITKTAIIITSTILIVFIALIIWNKMTSNVEHPKYKTLSSFKNIEIRQYEPVMIAETEVSGTRKEAINKGFKLLANYIFGNNTKQSSIAMTAPVQQADSTKISMTAPVTQTQNEKSWLVRFFMPSEYTMQTLPKPNNKLIRIKQLPEQQYVAIRFSGFSSPSKLESNSTKLKKFIAKNNLKTSSEPIYAFYNPPWTLPFLRRNEIMIQIQN